MAPLRTPQGRLERLQLTQAICSPGSDALIIDEDNSRAGYTSISDALERDLCFAVDVRDGVIACDADLENDSEPPWIGAAKRAVERIGGRWILTGSGRAGHCHLWCVSPVGWRTVDLRAVLSGAGVPSAQLRAGQRVRPPLTRHRSGGWGTLVEPASFGDALRVLARRPGSLPLSMAMRTIMEVGDREGVYKRGDVVSRDVCAYALAVAYVNADMGCDRYRADMLDPRHRAGIKAQQIAGRDPIGARNYLEAVYRDANDWVKANPPEPMVDKDTDEWSRLSRTLECHAWTGRSGATDRVVFAALVDIARVARVVEVGTSLRTLSVRTGVRLGTVRKSLVRLEEARLLERLDRESARASGRYRLIPYAVSDTSISISTRGAHELLVSVEGTSLKVVHDAFRSSGLPRGSLAVLTALSADGDSSTIAEIAVQVVGPARSTIRSHLHRLADHGLVVQHGSRGMLWRRELGGTRLLDEAAVSMGTAGARTRHANTVEIERDLYRRAREDYFPLRHLQSLERGLGRATSRSARNE